MSSPSSYPDPFHGRMTLDESKPILREQAQNGGGECPLCTLFVKVYSHKCDSAMARTLIVMYRRGAGGQFVHVPSLPVWGGKGDHHKVSQLSWWDLVTEEKVRRPDGGRAGYWCMTRTGIDFVERRLTIPKYALIFDARVLGHDGPQVGIEDCLGDKFNYRELMDG